MFSVADLLERAKASAGLESDYRLAKVLSINQSALSNYKCGRSFPNDKILSQLCALSGDDVAIVAAQIQAERSQSQEGKNLWLMIAARLQSDRRAVVRTVTSAILSVLFTIGLIATPVDPARAGEVDQSKNAPLNLLYIV